MVLNFSLLYYTLITRIALDLAFSSLYRDEAYVTEEALTSTVAAAAMIQMVSFK